MFKKIIILSFIIAICVSCTKEKKVYLIKQWHLSPNENSLDLEAGRKSPKFKNQIDVYERTLALIEKGSGVVIAEGCEDENAYLKKKFNGWDLDSLKTQIGLGDLKDTLAPVPLKIKAQDISGVSVLCGDNNKLIKNNNLAFSDLRGFVNFFQRLIEYKGKDNKKYLKYKKAFSNIVDLKEEDDAILKAKDKSFESLKQFTHFIQLRNYHFVKKIVSTLDKNPVLIIGGLHIEGITKELDEAKIPYEVITPSGYPEEEDLIIKNLQALLSSYKPSKMITYQAPSGFTIKSFPIINRMSFDSVADSSQLKELKALAEQEGIPLSLLISDFDKDGIRDFTLSATDGLVVLSAEDNDWDNDGVVNLIDSTLGKKKLFSPILNSKDISNSYSVEKTNIETEIKKITKKGISLIQDRGAKHDILILKVINEVFNKVNFPKENLKTLSATSPKFTYGKQSFFSYIKQSRSLEIYPINLLNFLAKKKREEYADINNNVFINGIVIPILIHSISHEIGHMQNVNYSELALTNGWSWKVKPYHSKYLTDNREEGKKIEKIISKLKYENKTYEEHLKEHKQYLQEINSLLKKYKKNNDYIKAIKKSKWYVLNNSKSKEYQSSFLLLKKVPSLYSLSSPSEWYAEVYASCIFQKFYPEVTDKVRAIKYEVLIGFNPFVHVDICQ